MSQPRPQFSYRRYARIAALQALCLAETNRISISAALNQAISLFEEDEVQAEILPKYMLAKTESGEKSSGWFDPESGLPPPVPGAFAPAPRLETEEPVDDPKPAWWDQLERFARMVADGVWERKFMLDDELSAAIPDYDYERLALIDRNMMRICLWELRELEYIPPAVSINEAIEIVKKFSTAESSRFVNGVLGTVVKRTRKANWNPKAAPPDPEFRELERSVAEAPVEVIEVEVEEGTKEAKEARRYGWVLKSGDREIPALTDNSATE